MYNKYTIVLLAAMEKEANELLPLLGSDIQKKKIGPFDMWEGNAQDSIINYLILTGIGKVNAACAACEAILHLNPSLLLNVGVSGAVHKSVKYGDIVVASQLAYHDVYCGTEIPYGQVQGVPRFFQASDVFLKHCSEFLPPESSHIGLVCCGEKFMSDHNEFENLTKHYPQALAADMESGAIAQVAYLYNVPLSVIRMISDTPYADNSYMQYIHFWEEDAFICFKIMKAVIKEVVQSIKKESNNNI